MKAAVPARTLPTRRNGGRTVALNPNRRAAKDTSIQFFLIAVAGCPVLHTAA